MESIYVQIQKTTCDFFSFMLWLPEFTDNERIKVNFEKRIPLHITPLQKTAVPIGSFYLLASKDQIWKENHDE
jgi:hypothetical protein